MFPLIVRQAGVVPSDAVGQEPTRRTASCRMLCSGRRVIDPAPDLRLVTVAAASLCTCEQVGLKRRTRFADVVP